MKQVEPSFGALVQPPEPPTRRTSIVVVIVLVFSLVLKSYRMTNDALAPEIQRGQLVLVARTGVLSLRVNAGDVVAYRRNGRAYLRRVVVANEEHVKVEDDGNRLAIPIAKVVGKMIYVAGGGKKISE